MSSSIKPSPNPLPKGEGNQKRLAERILDSSTMLMPFQGREQVGSKSCVASATLESPNLVQPSLTRRKGLGSANPALKGRAKVTAPLRGGDRLPSNNN